jgi:hypothetical protein
VVVLCRLGRGALLEHVGGHHVGQETRPLLGKKSENTF